MGKEVFEPANQKDSIKATFYRPFLLAILSAAIGIMAVLLWPFRHALVLALVLATLMSPLRTRLPLLLRRR
ncbi:MAG: hypothetical protein R6W92_08455 [Desulfocurvibacter africanus]